MIGLLRVALGMEDECWTMALQNLGTASIGILLEDRSSCDAVEELSQRQIAANMTLCHFERSGRRSRLLSDSAPTTCYDVLLPSRSMPVACAKDFTDAGFQVFTEFLNHFDNLCYYYISQNWFKRVSGAVDSLLDSSVQVLKDLQTNKEHALAISQRQHEMSNMQRRMRQEAENIAIGLRAHNEALSVATETHLGEILSRSTRISDMVGHLVSTIAEVQEAAMSAAWGLRQTKRLLAIVGTVAGVSTSLIVAKSGYGSMALGVGVAYTAFYWGFIDNPMFLFATALLGSTGFWFVGHWGLRNRGRTAPAGPNGTILGLQREMRRTRFMVDQVARNMAENRLEVLERERPRKGRTEVVAIDERGAVIYRTPQADEFTDEELSRSQN